MLGFFKRKPRELTYEQKCAALEQCGIAPRPPHTWESLRGQWPLSDKPDADWLTILSALGHPGEDDFDERFSDSFFVFDSECIEKDDDSYAEVMQDLVRITQGDLVVRNLASSLVGDDLDELPTRAWVELDWAGKHYRLDFAQDADWFQDPRPWTC